MRAPPDEAEAFLIMEGAEPPKCYPIAKRVCAYAHAGVVTVEATFGCSSGTVVVTVEDTTPPDITALTASPDMLWPPNHKMVPVDLAGTAADLCDAAEPTCLIISVVSNEAENASGTGNTAPDSVITGDLSVDLRAERAGSGSGRVYTVTVQCFDSFGNSATRTAEVVVPRDQRRNR